MTTTKATSLIQPVSSLFLSAGWLLAVVVSVLFASQASAAPIVGFKAGNIMDDYTFTKANSMNAGQIQAFLNAKVPVCDTWGTKPSEYGGGTRAQWAANASLHPSKGAMYPPFTCIKDYSENGRSAAQIIYDTAQEFQINPQVLIVLLQKEQGLITDTWPMQWQYRTATGYGCPDTAPCNTQYFGLTNQIRLTANMFHKIVTNDPSWRTYYVLGNNFIRWDSEVSCGGSIVNIENRATQALYNYTPYQPNQAALDAGYGSGDGCSTYGNRNFFLFFRDWFGNTQYTFGNTPANATLYARTPCSIAGFSQNEVGRLYQPDTRDFLYTTSHAEACLAVSYGYIWDGVVMRNATGPDAIPVYRISNPERHIYTPSTDIRTNYLNNFGYKDEGIAFYVYAGTGTNRTPVYGLQLKDTFFITSSGREALYYQQNYGFYNFGVMYYTDRTSGDPSPVYRISRNHSRLYTTNPVEKSSAITRYGFTDEGTISMNDLGPNDANLPVYRVRNPVNGGYVYIVSRLERDAAVVNNSHISEGAAFYSLMWSNSPIYRATNYGNLMRIYTNNLTEYKDAAARYGYTLEADGWYSY